MKRRELLKTSMAAGQENCRNNEHIPEDEALMILILGFVVKCNSDVFLLNRHLATDKQLYP